MKIIHYALGFPPYRTGGLTKFCMDLMLTQKEQGHEVALLWPGQIGIFGHRLSVKERKSVEGIKSYEIINPLPVALDEGISDVEMFMRKSDKGIYIEFFKKLKPDALHIHTLMGIHKELIEAANDLKIKTVFTTHDYYGLCPKVTFYHDGQVCTDDKDCKDCVACNSGGLSYHKIVLMQSPLYRILKNSFIVKTLRKKHRTKFFEESTVVKPQYSEEELNKKAEGYCRLRRYYTNILENIDVIHFNSSVSQMVYEKYITPKNQKYLSITHRGISDHRRVKNFNHDKLRITYLAPAKPFKGFQILKQALDELWEEGFLDFELNIFSLTNQVSPYMNIQDGYRYDELESIFDKTDLLVAPSVWYETFGFTVLEALSYGVPVLVSQNIGVKDLVKQCNNLIIKEATSKEIAKVIIGLNKEKLEELNLEILNRFDILTSDKMCHELIELYQS
jgi:Glycosyltransferase